MLLQHGSGKTAVLVERIIRSIIEQKINIDQLLIVTFTNAAASQMREKILDAIYKKLEENPNDEHLKKQTILIHKSTISTIHSFCLEVIRNHFFEIDVSANFRIGDVTELEILKQEAIENIFENKYISKDNDFEQLLDCYTNYKSDDGLKEIIFKIYEFIQSSPFPEEWLEEKVEDFNLQEQLDMDFAKTKWGKIILSNFKDEILGLILRLKVLKNKLNNYSEMQKFYTVVCEDITNLETIYEHANNWEEARKLILEVNFARWPTDKNIIMDLKDIAKQDRKKVKDDFEKIAEKLLLYTSRRSKCRYK